MTNDYQGLDDPKVTMDAATMGAKVAIEGIGRGRTGWNEEESVGMVVGEMDTVPDLAPYPGVDGVVEAVSCF